MKLAIPKTKTEEECAVRIKSISIADETYCTTKKLTASRRMKTMHKRRREQKQNDSTRNFNKSNQHHGTNTMARQSRIQTMAGLHSSKTLVDIPKSPSTMAIHKRTAILNIQNYAKGYQDKTYWKPFTMAKPNNIRDQHPDDEL